MQRVDLLGTILRIVPERAAPPIDPPSRVLVVKLSSIGDVVQALPVAAALKRGNPDVHVAWAVDEWTAPLVVHHRSIDRPIVLPSLITWPDRPSAWLSALAPAVREIRRDRYDVAIDLQGLARSALVSRLAHARVRIGRAGQREGSHLISYAVPLPAAPLHRVEEYLAVARHAGAAIDGAPVFDVPVQAAARLRVDRLLADAHIGPNPPLIVVSPSASVGWKTWPADRWPDVIGPLASEGQVVLIGSARQRPRHQDIAARAGRSVIDLSGRTSLADLVALLARASLHVSHDTGSAHIAAALGVPVVSIYGPTDPGRTAPYGQASTTIHHGDLCGPTCPAYCFRKRRCLSGATSDEVIAAARRALSGIIRPSPRPNTSAVT